MPENSFLTKGQLADRLNLSPRTLQGDRQRGGGIPFVKIGRSVRYDWTKVKEYLAQCARTSTSDTCNVAQGGK